MQPTVLLTSAREDSEEILNFFASQKVPYLHAPLEEYVLKRDDPAIADTLNDLSAYETIVYGSKRNAAFFWKHLKKHNQIEAAKKCLNLVWDEPPFTFLDAKGIPAVQSPYGNRPIDVVEWMLRLQQYGKVLYPAGAHRSEDFPRLLEELDIPVTELALFELKGPDKKELAIFQKKVKSTTPGAIIFHSRRSVTRTLAAFPYLDYRETHIISADAVITKKLEAKGMTVDEQAAGSWESIIDSFKV